MDPSKQVPRAAAPMAICIAIGLSLGATGQEFVRLEPVAEAGRVAFEPVGQGDERIGRVRWTVGNGTHSIPLQEPVSHCDAALVGDEGLVILAGGNKDGEDLQVYTVGAQGAIHIVPTGGGRRLPATFAGGLGSWPVADGQRLLMFAYRKDAAVQFRAIDFAGRIFATKALPEDVAGFDPSFEKATHQVRVVFGPGVELRFAHPDAPRLVVETGFVRFGVVQPGVPARRRVRVRNEGRREASLRGATDTPEFTLTEDGAWTIAPGQSVEIEVAFDPTAAGSTQGRLTLVTNAPEGPLTVVLRGERAPLSEPPTAVDPDPAPVPALLPPRAPTIAGVHVVGLGPGRFRVSGAVVRDADPTREAPLFVLFRDDDAGADRGRVEIAGGGGFSIEVEVPTGTALSARVVGTSNVPSAPSVVVARLGPALERTQDAAVVRGTPRAAYRIAVVIDVAGREVPLATWSGDLDADGRGELPFAALGEGRRGLVLRAWERSMTGVWIPTDSLIVR